MASLIVQIKPLRDAKGWTQAQLADKAKVTRATINRIENQRPRSIDLDVLDRIAKALGVAPGLLLVHA
jgi:transcriptional regulator with XRE-family HTH domain